MARLIIGVDADGVLTNLSTFNQENGKKFFKRAPINPNAYSVREMFGCSKLEELIYGLIYFPKYCKEYEPRVHAASMIQNLNAEGYPLYEITARKFATCKNIFGLYSRHMFQKWTKKYQLNFRSYEYCSETFSPRDKLLACHKLSVDVMVEDKPDVADYLAEHGIKVLLFDAPYNQELMHKNIIRVKNWDEAYQQIKVLEKELEPMKQEKFEVLSGEERNNLSVLQRKQYFKNYKNYLLRCPYDLELNQKYDNRFKLTYMFGKIPMAFTGLKVYGKENVPYQKGMLFASNHLNSYDQFLISAALGNRPLRGLAASTIKNTARGKLFQKTGITFVDRNDLESKKQAEENLCVGLVHGNDTLIFPEGTRKNKTEEGRNQKILNFKLGTAAIAQKTGAPIIPISIQYKKRFHLIKQPIVSFGEPILITYKSDIEKETEELKNSIVSMIDEVNHDKVKIKVR